ncbi:alpha/beta-hydrolase [Aspergillus campestris IBT 28561]|uniref:Alpha/beta-hydrolase n=1 Tax=Aspergillus campestris (strain IBT 28561) TaxID=1392248 RepID=A0A2I1CVU9_ASPC2|nr:alpha/beta-hydrolase [Aspergillus campestris IBT 28561]PKY01757.1 alpha/beta-hydrolase [Aspergillus campestris IBT 28561]
MSAMSAITPGRHLFTSARTHLTFEYIVQSQSPSTERLIVVQCPAWGLGSRYLQHGLSPLSIHHNKTLLFFHPRGTDNSSRPASASQMTSMPDLSTDLDDLRLHLHLDTLPTLLGHSNGGAIALGYAETHPHRINKLILLNHQLIGTSERRLITERATLAHDPRYHAAIAYSPPPSPHHPTDASFTRDITALWPLYFYNPQRHLGTLLSAIGDRVFPLWCYTAVYGCDAALQRPRQMIDGLGAVRAVTLIIAGRDDLACGLSIARQTGDGIPGARVLVYEECGHFPWIEQGERFMGDVLGFLRGV